MGHTVMVNNVKHLIMANMKTLCQNVCGNFIIYSFSDIRSDNNFDDGHYEGLSSKHREILSFLATAFKVINKFPWIFKQELT